MAAEAAEPVGGGEEILRIHLPSEPRDILPDPGIGQAGLHPCARLRGVQRLADEQPEPGRRVTDGGRPHGGDQPADRGRAAK